MPIQTSKALSSFLQRLEADERLEPLTEKVHAVAASAVKPLGGRTALSGTVLGHPLHPVLISTPIGLFTSAMVADLVGEREAARTLTGAGVVAAIPTALTGLSDWVDTADAERRVGFVHLVSNLTAVSTYALSWSARRVGLHGLGRLLGLLGAAEMTFAGWLGGHLAYGMGVGVDTTVFRGGPAEWTEIAAPGDAPQRHVVVNGVGLAVLEDDEGTTRVLADRCTHRGGPLSEGRVAGGCVTCPWHGSRFDLTDGHVVRGPATAPEPVYEVRTTGDGTEVRRSEPRALRRKPV